MTTLVDILEALPARHEEFSRWISPEPYETLARLVDEFRPKVLLEIGSLLGYSLIAFLHGADSIIHVDSVDNEALLPGSNAMCLDNVIWYLQHHRPRNAFAFHQHHTVWEYVGHCAPDMVFIDGDHTVYGALRDLVAAEAFHPRVIVMDNYERTEVVAAASMFEKAHGLNGRAIPVPNDGRRLYCWNDLSTLGQVVPGRGQ